MLTEYGPRILPFDFAEPWSTLRTEASDAAVGILGIPFDGGTGGRLGTAQAPTQLREMARHKTPVTEEGIWLGNIKVRDYGDVPIEKDWERFSAGVKARAADPLRHRLALFLGGDHSVTIPLTAAFDQTVQGSWGLIQFDAHPDLADIERGYRWSHACTARRAVELPGLRPEHLAFVGLRSYMPEEIDWLREHPEVAWYTARRCSQLGIERVAEDIIARMGDVAAIYFSLDIDGLDPAYAPGTGTPQAAGLSTRDLLELVNALFTQLPVRAMDVVEVAPPIDHADITSFAAIKVIYEVFGLMQEEGARA